jgi:hypothetical protein
MRLPRPHSRPATTQQADPADFPHQPYRGILYKDARNAPLAHFGTLRDNSLLDVDPLLRFKMTAAFIAYLSLVQRTMPLDTPPGWNALQERAKQVKDPQELVALIEEMNQLLSEYERTAGDGNGNGNGHGNGRHPQRRKITAQKASTKMRST